MKFCLRSIRFLLIAVLISFIGITPAASQKSVHFPDPYECYQSVEIIQNRLSELVSLYPDLAHLKTIGLSYEERPIQALQLGREVETNSKPKLVLISGLKANALAPVELNLQFAEHLLNSYGQDANITWLLNQTEIHLIVVANPDGRLIAEQELMTDNVPVWTKNRNPYNCATGNGGVALDLNFSYEWAAVNTDACAPDYPGPIAASEPETLAIQTYLETILTGNQANSLIIDLQNDGGQQSAEKIIIPFLYSKTAQNPLEDELYFLANKLAYDTQLMPLRGSSPTIDILTGTLIDYSFGELQTPSLRFNLGSTLAGGDVVSCWYFNEYLKPEGLAALTRAAIIAAAPLNLAQGPEITIHSIKQDIFSVTISGEANDMIFYKLPLKQSEYSAVHHVAFSIDVLPWLPNAALTPIAGVPHPEAPYQMLFEHHFSLTDIPAGRHMLYFQAWDTNSSGEPDHAGMVNAVEIVGSHLVFMPFMIK